MKWEYVLAFIDGAIEGTKDAAVICGGFALLAIAAKYCSEED